MALKTVLLCYLFPLVFCGCSNSSLEPLPPKAVILCFGDSITKGVGSSESNSYPQVLAELSGKTTINAGVSGETSAEGLKRLPAVLDQYSPDLVILCHGGNDILQRLDLEKTKANLINMIKLCQKRNAQVVMIAVPSVLSDAHPMYAEAAAVTNVPIQNNIFGKLIKNDAYKSDPIHLNAKGYRKFAEAIVTLLNDTNAL